MRLGRLRNRIHAERRLYLGIVLICVSITSFFDYFATSFRFSLATYVREDFGISFGEMSRLNGWIFLGSSLAIVPRFFSDLAGRKLMLCIMLVGLTFVPWILSFSRTPGQYVACLTVLALIYLLDVWMLFISEEAPESRRGFFVALTVAAGLMGAMTVGHFVRGMGEEVDAWRGIARFPVWGIIASLAILFLLREPERSPRALGRVTLRDTWMSVWRPFRGLGLRRLLSISLIKAVFMGALFAAILLIQFEFLRKDKGFSPEFIGRTLQLEVFVSAASALLVGHVSDRFGRRPTFFVCVGIFSTAIALLATLPQGNYALIAAHITQSGAATAINTLLRTTTFELFPDDCRASGSAWSDFLVTIVAASGAAVLAFLTKPLSEGGLDIELSSVLLGISACAIAIAPLYLLLIETRGQKLDEVRL